MKIYYPSEKLEPWLRANLPAYITPSNPLGLYNDGDGLGTWLESDNWPEAANGGAPPTVEEVAVENPVTDDERLRQGVALYKAANEAAKEIVLSLMVMVAGALIALKLFTEENVNDEGAKFVAFHRDALTDFERAGRNRLAAQSLLAAIKDPASVSTFEWLKESAVMAVFESALTY